MLNARARAPAVATLPDFLFFFFRLGGARAEPNSAAASESCFLQYDLGEVHSYEFDGHADIDHVTAAGDEGATKAPRKKIGKKKKTLLCGRQVARARALLLLTAARAP